MPESPVDKVQEILGTIAAVAPAAAGLAGVLGRLLEGKTVDPEEVKRELERARAESTAAIARLDDDHARRLVETSKALRESAEVVESAPVAAVAPAMRAAEDVLAVVRDEVRKTQAALLEGVRQTIGGLKAEVGQVTARVDGVASHVAEKVGVEVEGRLKRLEGESVRLEEEIRVLRAQLGPQPPEIVAGPPPPAHPPVS